MELFLQRVPQDSKYSPEYQRALCNGGLARFKALADYDPDLSRKIKAPITLIRPQIPTVHDAKEDYDLGTFTDNQIPIIYLEGNHFTIIDNVKLPTLINNYFGY